MKKWIATMLAAAAMIHAASLEDKITRELRAKMPLGYEGIEVAVQGNGVVLQGKALCVADKVAAERIAKSVTQEAVRNEIVIADPYLRDGF